MKKVLVVTCRLSQPDKVGSLRSRGLGNYLKQFGWEPVFLIPFSPYPPPPKHNVIETHPPYNKLLKYYLLKEDSRKMNDIKLPLPSAYKRPFLFIRSFIDFPDSDVGWKSFATEIAIKTLVNQKINSIITISDPVTCHLVGHTIKRKMPEIFWIADLRDPWTLYYEKSTVKNRLERNLEKNVLKKADAISIVTPTLAKDYSAFFPGKKVYTITNGFDPKEINKGSQNKNKLFTIIHTGSLYDGLRSPEFLFIAFRNLLKEEKISAFSLKFFGDKQKWLIEMAKKYGLSNFVECFGRVDRDVILKLQRESDALFLPANNLPRGKAYLTGKIFEYLAAMRPILYSGEEDSDIANLLRETKSGKVCPDISTIQDTIYQWYKEWEQYGAPNYKGIKKDILKYSHQEMARKFSSILDNR